MNGVSAFTVLKDRVGRAQALACQKTKAGELSLPGFRFGVAELATLRPHTYGKHRLSQLPSQESSARVLEGGKTVLIDAGGGVTIANYLRQLHVDTIDLVVASHNHSDHIGGMPTVLGTSFVRFYMDNGIPHTTATYRNTIQAVQSRGVQYLEASDGQSHSATTERRSRRHARNCRRGSMKGRCCGCALAWPISPIGRAR
jgi:metallo-beta-lactamase superfamily protein